MAYFVSLDQRTGDAAIVSFATGETIATFARAEHGDETVYVAQRECAALNAN